MIMQILTIEIVKQITFVSVMWVFHVLKRYHMSNMPDPYTLLYIG